MGKSNLFEALGRHFQEKFWLYIITILFFCTGIVLGIYTVKYMGQVDKGELSNYFISFIEVLDSKPINNKAILFQTLKSNIPMIIAIFVLGFTIIGLPIILVINIIKGFSIGFTFSFLISVMGKKGIALALIGVTPQNIIYIPCTIISSVIAMEISFNKIRNRINRQASISFGESKSYITAFIIILGVIILGGFIEGYITPSIIRYMFS